MVKLRANFIQDALNGSSFTGYYFMDKFYLESCNHVINWTIRESWYVMH